MGGPGTRLAAAFDATHLGKPDPPAVSLPAVEWRVSFPIAVLSWACLERTQTIELCGDNRQCISSTNLEELAVLHSRPNL